MAAESGIIIEELERVFPKMRKICEIETARKNQEDDLTATWFFKKLTELGEMNIERLQQLNSIKTTQTLPLNSQINQDEENRWQIDISSYCVYARLKMNATKSRGISRLLNQELTSEILRLSGWRIEHRVGTSLTFCKNFVE